MCIDAHILIYIYIYIYIYMCIYTSYRYTYAIAAAVGAAVRELASGGVALGGLVLLGLGSLVLEHLGHICWLSLTRWNMFLPLDACRLLLSGNYWCPYRSKSTTWHPFRSPAVPPYPRWRGSFTTCQTLTCQTLGPKPYILKGLKPPALKPQTCLNTRALRARALPRADPQTKNLDFRGSHSNPLKHVLAYKGRVSPGRTFATSLDSGYFACEFLVPDCLFV